MASGGSNACEQNICMPVARQISRGTVSDKSADVRAASAGALTAVAVSQAGGPADKAFNAVRLHDAIEVLKRGLVDKVPFVVDAYARSMVRHSFRCSSVSLRFAVKMMMVMHPHIHSLTRTDTHTHTDTDTDTDLHHSLLA